MIIDQTGNKLQKHDQVALVITGMLVGMIVDVDESQNTILIGIPMGMIPNQPTQGIVKTFKQIERSVVSA